MVLHQEHTQQLRAILTDIEKLEQQARKALARAFPAGTAGTARIRHGQKNLTPCVVHDHWGTKHLMIRLTETHGDRRGNPIYKTIHFSAFTPTQETP